MVAINNTQKKEWARTLYLKEWLTQSEIAERIGVARITIGRWVKDGKWEELRACASMSRSEQIASWHRQIAEINRIIEGRDKGQRIPTSAEVMLIAQLTTAINKMETEAGIHEMVGVGERFIAWLRTIDMEKTKEFAPLFNAFIQSQL